MPRTRTWSAESRNPGKSWGELEPVYAPVLTESEIRLRRLELAAEMLELVLSEDSLPTKPKRTLQGIYSSLRQFRRQL
jgi:hypothetical protein